MSPPPPRGRRDHSRSAAAALLQAAPLVSRWTERLLAQAEPPLTVSQYLALQAIADEPRIEEPLTAVELARRAGVSGPAVSQLVASLVAAGWVERREALSDRRRQDLLLTDAGATALQSSSAALTAQLAELLTDVPAPELDALARALPVVRAALAGRPPPRRPGPPGPRRPGPPGPRRPRPPGPRRPRPPRDPLR